MAKYSIGLDFGTLSVRAILVDVESGKELSTAVYAYPHGVISEALPCGRELPAGWALQHPQEYLDGIAKVIPEAVRKAGVSTEDVIGIGLDFTSNTFLPVDENYVPLCTKKEFEDRPHAWVKLWKHHGNSSYAARMTKIARERHEPFLKYYAENVSAEWIFPRILEIFEEDRALYDAAYSFIEAGDWIVQQLTGNDCRSICIAGYKALWSKEYGFPSEDYFAAVNPEFRTVVKDKMAENYSILGTSAGGLSDFGAKLTGLNRNVAVSVCSIDAEAAMPLARELKSGNMLICFGTSGCHIMVASEFREIPGTSGTVEDGIVPGLFAYEAGQRCVGDALNWVVDNCVPPAYAEKAKESGKNIHQYLTELAEKQRPGENGLIALDWWNGNRSILGNFDLSGLLLGMTMETKPEDIYRAFIEATAYGTRKIVESYEENGIKINNIFGCGGIAKKNPLFMQIYADVLNRKIQIIRTEQAPAMGSAMFGAVAAGKEHDGYANIIEAAEAMCEPFEAAYTPIRENVELYNELYDDYTLLHDYFGRGGNDVMMRMRRRKENNGNH